jgi:hypothetical protein
MTPLWKRVFADKRTVIVRCWSGDRQRPGCVLIVRPLQMKSAGASDRCRQQRRPRGRTRPAQARSLVSGKTKPMKS